MQITMSPYYGTPDFTVLDRHPEYHRIDPVSVADLLRNAFVYPPHSIYEGVKLVTFGFSAHQDMRGEPDFHFKFRNAGEVPEVADRPQDWIAVYHRMLCDAITRTTADMRSPWQLQSGGKDSTTLAIALADARPDTTCITYLGGREENELESARQVASRLGLRHEALVCDPGRAYDRYLALADRMPLLTADFALLSYADLATEVAARGGDGIIDGLGADSYFGTPVDLQQQLTVRLARGLRLPFDATGLPGISGSFPLCFALGTLQMTPIERVFPGSRFSDAEVDALFGFDVARRSRERLSLFKAEIASATSAWEWRDMSMSIAGSAGAFAKGLYTAHAAGLGAAYPFCDRALREWIHHEVPRRQKVDPETGLNKVLIRRHIAAHFGELPYVQRKGSFRFDVCGLAAQRFEQVHAFAAQVREMLPGATAWLERNRDRLDNKYHASKFYLLAVVLPWLAAHAADAAAAATDARGASMAA